MVGDPEEIPFRDPRTAHSIHTFLRTTIIANRPKAITSVPDYPETTFVTHSRLEITVMVHTIHNPRTTPPTWDCFKGTTRTYGLKLALLVRNTRVIPLTHRSGVTSSL